MEVFRLELPAEASSAGQAKSGVRRRDAPSCERYAKTASLLLGVSRDEGLGHHHRAVVSRWLP